MRRALFALAILAAAADAHAVDGTSAQRTAFAKANPCPVNGKPLLTCTGYQVVWDRYPCIVGAQLARVKISAAKARTRSAAMAAACARSKVAYDACMVQPWMEVMVCMTSGCKPSRRWRDCAALIK